MSVEVKAQNTLSMTSVKAIKDATDEANTLLDGMRQSAIDAGTTLNGIYQDAMDAQASADNAQASADSASEYASRAYANLSTLQSLTETLNWITAHGTMTLTTDTQLDPRHIYFVADQNGDYVVGGQHYAVVSEPDVADISTYYELSINESLNNYVATHLAVDGEGLWIIPDAGGNKVLIATGSGSTYTSAGTYIIGKENGVDVVLSSFTEGGARVGQESKAHLTVTDTSIEGKSETGANFFSVSSDGGSGTSKKYTLMDAHLGSDETSFDLSEIIGEEWTSIPNGDNFEVSIAYYETNGTVTRKHKGTIVVTYTKGQSEDTNATQKYVAPNTVIIKNYYPTLDTGYTFSHKVVYFVKVVTLGDMPFYRFGTDVAESGGNNSFLMGTGTVASYNNQLAIGEYNAENQPALFMIGKGGSDSDRRNIFEVGAFSNVDDGYVLINGAQLRDFVKRQGSVQVTDFGTGYWRYREWYSGKVELWYNGTITLTTRSTSSGLYRNAGRIPFPKDPYSSPLNPQPYALYRCTGIVNGTVGGGWLNCGGLFNSSDVHADPISKIEAMAYQINTYPANDQTNVNIYVCGEKTI